jgi:hypothetical protein
MSSFRPRVIIRVGCEARAGCSYVSSGSTDSSTGRQRRIVMPSLLSADAALGAAGSAFESEDIAMEFMPERRKCSG